MSEMIERCIRAANETGLDFEDWVPAAKERLVRAIINEMLEPTQEMYDALTASNIQWENNGSRGVFRSMIRGALGLTGAAGKDASPISPGKWEAAPDMAGNVDRSIRLLEIALDAAKTGETRLHDAALDGALFLIHPIFTK